MDARQKRYLIMRGWCLRVLLFLYDAFVINLAYLTAILLRLSDSDVADKRVFYTALHCRFAPYYTIFCLVLFIIFRLYGGVWRYAGINDVKKLFTLNGAAAIAYIGGSLLIVGRMPISVYILGACLQLVLVSAPRLLPRYFTDNFGEFTHRSNSDISIPLMLVGVCENARIIQNRIENDRTNIVKPVLVADCMYGYTGKQFNGLPVFCGSDAISEAVKKYNIRSAIIADNNMPKEFLDDIYELCDRNSIEIRDFVIGTEYRFGGVGIKELLKTTAGPVHIREKGKETREFSDGRTALQSIEGEGIVDAVSAHNDVLIVTIRQSENSSSDVNGEWVEQYRKETGNDISFF